MKKQILILGISIIALVACKKESGNKNVIKEEKVETIVTNKNGVVDSVTNSSTMVKNGDLKIEEKTYRYVAEDGSNANITFTNSLSGNYISIRSNNKTIQVKQKKTDEKAALYEENGIQVKSEGDIITITQGNNVIELKKAKGQ